MSTVVQGSARRAAEIFLVHHEILNASLAEGFPVGRQDVLCRRQEELVTLNRDVTVHNLLFPFFAVPNGNSLNKTESYASRRHKQAYDQQISSSSGKENCILLCIIDLMEHTSSAFDVAAAAAAAAVYATAVVLAIVLEHGYDR